MPLGANSVWSFDLNESGQTAGWVSTADAAYQPYLWSTSGGTPIPLLPGWAFMQTGPYPLNDVGQVVGTGSGGAWIWDAANGSRALSGLVPESWFIDEAMSINDRGQIVARAHNSETGYVGHVLLEPSAEPVPEPAAWTLLATGLLLLAARARRRSCK